MRFITSNFLISATCVAMAIPALSNKASAVPSYTINRCVSGYEQPGSNNPAAFDQGLCNDCITRNHESIAQRVFENAALIDRVGAGKSTLVSQFVFDRGITIA